MLVTGYACDRALSRPPSVEEMPMTEPLVVQREVQIVALANGRFDWPGAMHDLASALPGDVHLSTFDASLGTGSSGAPAPAAPSSAGAATGAPSVHLTGCAPSHTEVGDVINRLRGIPNVAEVAFATSAKGGTARKKKAARKK